MGHHNGHTGVHALVLAAVLSTGCRKIEPAPAALDRLFPWFFTKIDEGSDEELAEGIRNLHKAGKVAQLEDTVDGTISKLTKDELAVVDLQNRDPSKASGVYMLNKVTCGLPQLERILYHKQQDDLYEDTYDRYDRTFTTDKQAYIDRDTAELSWEVEYDATILGKECTSTVLAKLRRVPVLDDEQSPFGPALIARAHIPRPAQFSGGNTSLSQDYQIEMYYKAGNGEILHAYGIWREADFGGGVTSDNEGSQVILLNELAKWDEVTETLCEEGRP